MDKIYTLKASEKYLIVVGLANYCERYNSWRYSFEDLDFPDFN